MNMETDVRLLLFSVRLERLMRVKKITQKELAEYLGVSQPTVNRWLKGKFEPSFEKLFVLCAVLGTSPNHLFGYVI